MPTARKTLTKSVIDAAKLTTKGQRVIWDDKLRGLGLLIGIRRKSFFLQRHAVLYGVGKERRRKLGVTGEPGGLTIEQARQRAEALIAQWNEGRDPQVEEQKQEAEIARDNEQAITLAQAWEQFPKRKFKLRTLARYTHLFEKYLVAWHDRPLRSITKQDARDGLTALAADIAAGKYGRKGVTGETTADAAFQLLRTVYNDAARMRDDLPANPCGALTKDWFNPKTKRKALSDEQLRVWWAGVQQIANPIRRDVLLFMLFTGMRRTASCEARWEDVDLERRVLHVPESEGSKGAAFDLPLSDYLITLLRGRKTDSPWVFPSVYAISGHVEDPHEAIEGVDWAVHDLRRTFITNAVRLDINPYKVKKLVNHKLSKTDVTAGYTHLTVDDLRVPMQMITDSLLRTVDGTPADVIPFKRESA